MNPAMNNTLVCTLATAAALALAPAAQAATSIDTGTPTGDALFGFAFDGNDPVAAKVTFANATTISAISGYFLGGGNGETFDVSLVAGGTKPTSGSQVFTTTATYGSDGWNGASGLGWNIAAGTYWIEFEVNWNDTLGQSMSDGPLVLPTGVAHPVPTFTSGDGGFTYFDNGATSIGLQVSTVPWPATAWTMLAGVAMLASLARARRRA